MQRVAVTGLGIVSPIGQTKTVFFDNLMAAKSGVKRLPSPLADSLEVKIAAYIDDFDAHAHFAKHQIATLDRTTQLAVVAAQYAVTDAGIDFARENLDRAGVYIGTGMGGSSSLESSYFRLFKENAVRLKPFTVLMGMNNAASSQIGLKWQLTGPNLTFCTACSSSSVAIGEAAQQIRYGETDIMLAGGTDALLTTGTIKAWEALRTLAEEDLEDPSRSCKPFAANRTGLVLGEGAAIIVLENLNKARARGAHIYAELIGYCSSNDSSHITQPSVEGQARAMRGALLRAGVNTNELDYINAHGTGTKLNDIAETLAIKEVCGTQVPISSTKSMHGHLMGASGAVEFIACMMAFEKQALPPTAHLAQRDTECDLDYIPNVGRQARVNTLMSNSFAFGGTCGVLVARKAVCL